MIDEPAGRGYFHFMMTGFSKLTRAEARKEIQQMRKYLQKNINTPAEARNLLVRAGILTKSGKRLSKAYL
jgi:hypothetical protein